MRKILLKSSDEQTFEVDERFGRESKMIQHMINGGCADSSTISLPSVRGEIVAKIIEYLNLRHAVNDDAVGNSSSLEEALKRFDVEFVDGLDPPTLLPIFVAARCLDMNKLLDLTIKKMFNLVMDKTPDEVRATFNFVDDISTPEEDARIRALVARMT